MRHFLMLFVLIVVSGCSRPDFDVAVQVQAWLESLDPAAEVIEVRCSGNIEEPPGSGTWKEYSQTDRWPAREVLAVVKNKGLDWGEIVAHCISTTKYEFPRWLFNELSKRMTPAERLAFKMRFRVEDVRCDGKPLRSPPPVAVGTCPNDVQGCDEPPAPTDQPPLPPPPEAGDF